MPDDVVVVSTFLPDEAPKESDRYGVLGVECVGEFCYWKGLSSVWEKGLTVVNVERDMEFSDELVAGLVDCPHPLCAYPYKVFPTQLKRFIYCATTDGPHCNNPPRWLTGPSDEWACWSSIGFAKFSPQVQTKPLDKMFWKWFEHSINRVVSATTQVGALATSTRWHIHWPEVKHFHDYGQVPDHLW